MKKILLGLAFCSSLLWTNSLEEIQQKNDIRIGVRMSLPPFSEQTSNGFEGFEIKLAEAIGKSIVGNKGSITLIGIDAKDRIPMLQNNEIDLAIANFSKTPEREKEIDFSVPYFSNFLAVLSRKIDAIKNTDDLKSKKVLYIKSTTAEKYLNEKQHNIAKIECSNKMDCFQKLQSGEADAYMHTNILIAQLPLIDNNIEMSIKALGAIEYISVGVRKNNKELLSAVNKEIINLSRTNFFKNAYNDTFEPFYKGTIERKYFLLDDLYKALF